MNLRPRFIAGWEKETVKQQTDFIMGILAMPCDEGGCGSLRIRQPMYMIHEHTQHGAGVIDSKENMNDIASALMKIHVGVLRPGAEAGIKKLRQEPEFKHIKWVLDIDDNVELIDPYSDHYEQYGTEPFFDSVFLNDWLWKQGEKGFNIAENKKRLVSLLNGISEADLVTVTTPKLAEYARQYNDNVAVLPNCLDLSQWWKLPLKPNETLRVGWSGGSSHYVDWYSIKEPLNALLRKYQFTLVSVGTSFTGIIDDDLKHLVEVHPWVPFKAHSYHMMCMNLDAAIIPLSEDPFNAYKSAVKWYEFSAMGVPSVVANVTPYKEEIASGTNALGYSTPEQFYLAMEAMLGSAELREKISAAAMVWVHAHRDAAANAHLWTDAYSSLLT